MCRIVAALVDLGYPKSYQSHLSNLAVAAGGPMSWLDEVKGGFGMRYGAAFASEGFEDADDLKFSCPNQQKLESILEKAGAAKPQVERITAALVKLTGAPLQQEEPQKDAGRSTPPSSYFRAKESPPATPTANTWPGESSINTPRVEQTTPTRAKPSAEEDQHLEILRQRSQALTVDVVSEEGRSQPKYGGGLERRSSVVELNAAATSLWSGPTSSGKRPNRAISKRASSTFGKGPARWSSTSSMEGTKSNGGPPATKKGSSSKIHTVVSPKGKGWHGKHAMLSYQWDHQVEVTAIRKMLEVRGICCWMDVDQMQSDIYDSMAEGVQGARVIVCFMSQPYQDSANCKLELKFAQQSGKPIVPVKMVPEFEATGCVLSRLPLHQSTAASPLSTTFMTHSLLSEATDIPRAVLTSLVAPLQATASITQPRQSLITLVFPVHTRSHTTQPLTGGWGS